MLLSNIEDYLAKNPTHLNKRVSKDGFYTLFDYSEECAFGRHWNLITMSCRGIVFDSETGELVSRCAEKFFNLGEPSAPNLGKGQQLDINGNIIPWEIQEKIDGSALFWFYSKRYERWHCHTRGSLESSVYTEYGNEFAHLFEDFDKKLTIWTEVCLPPAIDGLKRASLHEPGVYLWGGAYTRSNMKYGEYEIIQEVSLSELKKNWKGKVVQTVASNTLDPYIEKAKTDKNIEGWVVRWEPGCRVKIKTLWYLEVFRLLHFYTNERLVDSMIASLKETEWTNPFKFLAGIPEEIRQEFEAKAIGLDKSTSILLSNLSIITEEKKKIYTTRKDFAISIKDDPNKSYYFLLLDGKYNEAREKLLYSFVKT